MTTISAIKVKVQRKPVIKLKVMPRFPAEVIANNFLTITRNGATYTFDIDYTKLVAGAVTDPDTAMVAVLDQTEDTYKIVSLASLLTSGLDADLQAIAALTGTGILTRTAADTWAFAPTTGTGSTVVLQTAPALISPTANTLTLNSGAASYTTMNVQAPSSNYGVSVILFDQTSAARGYFDFIQGAGSGTRADTIEVGSIGKDMTFRPNEIETVRFPIAIPGRMTLGVSGALQGTLGYAGATSGVTVLQAAAAASGVLTLPAATDTLVGRATTDTLSNKTLVAPALGTPTSVVLTNATGLPVSTGISGLATGIAAFLATPSSANLRTALTDEVGTGAAYFVGGALGTPASGTATNLTGLPLSTGVTGTLQAAQFPALTGDITTVAGALGTTIANDSVTYAKMQNISATARVLGRKTAGAGDTEELSLSDVLDLIGSAAQGDILYRGASGWSRLGAGASGNFLKTQGAAANPTWAAVPGGGDMLAANNLSDLASLNAAATNFGVVRVVKKQIFTSSGTYTPSTGMLYAQIDCLGGGGGGGGITGPGANAACGGGGGGAGSFSSIVSSAATIGASKTVTIGAGGSAGASAGGTGGAGGDTSVGVICVGKGGLGGAGTTTTFPGAGGAGGVPGTGTVTSYGGSGKYPGSSGSVANLFGQGGNGADSCLGAGGVAGIAGGNAVAGVAALGYGAGGSGASAQGVTSSAAGGAGTPGIVIITEYCTQ